MAQSPPLSDDLRAILKGHVEQHGEAGASRALGIPRHTLARCIAGLGVRAGTVALVEKAIAKAQEATP
jgi:hypothetical protein